MHIFTGKCIYFLFFNRNKNNFTKNCKNLTPKNHKFTK